MHLIQTKQLDLLAMTPEFFNLCRGGNLGGAEAYTGVAIPDDWMQRTDYIKRRGDQLAADPAYGPWCTRLVVLRERKQMIGYAGFHAPPSRESVHGVAPGWVELGYTIFPAFRRRGFARETVEGLMRWAANEMGIKSFVVSIAPDNAASQALARSLGFVKVGEQIDEEDGLEDVLLLLA